MSPSTRGPALSPEEAERIRESEGEEALETFRKAPWFYPLLEWGFKGILAILISVGLWLGARFVKGQDDAVDAIISLKGELIKQGNQIENLTDTMRVLSGRQDIAIQKAESALGEASRLDRDVELFKYYLLELDAKAIAAGIKPASEAIATQIAKDRKRKENQP